MNNTIVPTGENLPHQALLAHLTASIDDLTPELRKAAAYILDHPNDVSVSSIREIAVAAKVKPNTFVRMARAVGFEGYEEFREPFREEIRNRSADFPDRARWLQSLSKEGKLGGLYAGMAASAIENIENTFARTDAKQIKTAADAIVSARRTYVLGVGVNHTLAHNFAYLANMAIESVTAIPKQGGHILDDFATADNDDVLLAMTFKPYRTEVVEAVHVAKTQGVKIIGVSDSAASPIVTASNHGFVVASDTPQFFPSIVAAAAFLETLMAFVVADASPNVIARIRHFHERRNTLGMYLEEPEAKTP